MDNATVLKIFYCGFAIKLENGKVVYCAKYGPKSGTISPQIEIINSHLEPDSHITKEQFSDFITSDVTKQVDGRHKGGRWGTENFTVTSNHWFPGLYVGDIIKVSFGCPGIIPNKFNADKSPKAFDNSDQIIADTENLAWSCNAIWNGKEYHFYMTDNVMPQVATDTFFINYVRPKNQNPKIYVKVLKRGNDTKNVDSPGREMPCAGEHLEPGQSNDKRKQVMFTVNEELGLPEKTLNECYLLDLGVYNKEGRDGRYSTYCIDTVNGRKRFGIKRQSSSTARTLLIISEVLDLDDENVLPEDTTEINSKRWVDVDKVLSEYNEDNWMLTEHLEMLRDAVNLVNKFANEPRTLQEKFKF